MSNIIASKEIEKKRILEHAQRHLRHFDIDIYFFNNAQTETWSSSKILINALKSFQNMYVRKNVINFI